MGKRQISFVDLDIDGLIEISPFFIEDERGYFLKNFEKGVYSHYGINFNIDEDFESYSPKGVLRGMHFQDWMPQSKLVRAVYGEIFDVVVDLRKKSSTYGQWQSVILNSEKRNTLHVPRGCAHGYLVLSDYAIVNYKCAGKYLFNHDTGIIWNDHTIGIKWPLNLIDKLVISSRDLSLQSFTDFAARESSDQVFTGVII